MTSSGPAVLCAVVTYNESLQNTNSGRSLSLLPERWKRRLKICSVENEGSTTAAFNSEAMKDDGEFAGMQISQWRSRCNGGLSLGYNFAVMEFQNSEMDYVLFLNADSHVDEELLDAFDAFVRNSTPIRPMALAPTLWSNGLKVSPFRKVGFAHPFFIIGFMFCHRDLFQRAFRFPAEFWLDGIDYWFSHYLAGLNISVVKIPVDIQHRLSVADGFRSIPKWRYQNIILAELKFHRMFGGGRKLNSLVVAFRGAAKCVVHMRLDLLGAIWRAYWQDQRNDSHSAI